MDQSNVFVVENSFHASRLFEFSRMTDASVAQSVDLHERQLPAAAEIQRLLSTGRWSRKKSAFGAAANLKKKQTVITWGHWKLFALWPAAKKTHKNVNLKSLRRWQKCFDKSLTFEGAVTPCLSIACFCQLLHTSGLQQQPNRWSFPTCCSVSRTWF